MMNVFTVSNNYFKYYSTISYSAENNKPPETILNPVEYKNWTKEQVCSLLCIEEQKGGAGLIAGDVKLLYDAGFKGASIANIVTNIQEEGKKEAVEQLEKQFTKAGTPLTVELSTTLQTVVNWADTLLKTRLYHLWSVEKVREHLCEPIESGGASLSHDEATNISNKLLTNLEKYKNTLPKDTFDKIVVWKEQQMIMVTPKFYNTKFDPPQFNDLSYQNNKNTIKMMARTLLSNIQLHRRKEALRYQTLLINSAYFGSGKTRLGVEFLSQFKLQFENNLDWRKELLEIFSSDDIKQLESSKIVYVNCKDLKIIDNDLTKTFEHLKYQIASYLECKSIESIPCFIILDEIGSLVTNYSPNKIQGIHHHFSSMYSILNEFIYQFQRIPTISLYVCGKGAFMDIVGTGRLRPALQSPTLVKSILLESFSEKDIEMTLKNTTNTASLLSHLQNNGLVDYFVKKIHEETRGVPYFVVHFILRGMYNNCVSKDDLEKAIMITRSTVPQSFLTPYLQFSNQEMLMQIYHTLLFAGIVGMEIDITKFNVHSFFPNIKTEGTEFEGIAALSILDISAILNCYLQPIGNKFKLLFPQAIIDTYLESYLSSKKGYNISWLVNEHGELLSKGNTLEHLTRTILRFKMSWGAAQNSTIGEILPFLSKTSVANIPCYNLETLNLCKKLTTNEESNKQGWEKVIQLLKGTGKLGYFYDASHSPDEFWNVLSTTETYIAIQDKNLESNRFKLKEEIEKNEKVRTVIGDNIQLIMVFMTRSESIWTGTYYGGTTVDNITLHKNTTLVVLSKEDVLLFYGNSNLSSLKQLAISHKK